MNDPSGWTAPRFGPLARMGAPPRAAGTSAEAPDAHARQRARVVASLVLHPYPKDKRHAPKR
jgi:hypothetical protein